MTEIEKAINRLMEQDDIDWGDQLPDMSNITRRDYSSWASGFIAGNSSVDYAFRNAWVGDGEEINLVDDYQIAQAAGPEALREWREQWSPPLSHEDVEDLEFIIEGEDLAEMAADHLREYISNLELFIANDALWCEVFFAATNIPPKSYDDFVAEFGEEYGEITFEA